MTMKLTESAERILELRYYQKGETWEKLCTRVSSEIATAELTPELRSIWQQNFFDALYNLYMVPNSPTLKNAGTVNKMLAACFLGDQLIVTDEGLKPIKDIITGDMVLTHDHIYSQVTQCFQRFVNDYYEIDIAKQLQHTLKVTSEHPILVLENNKKVFKQVKDLTTSDYVHVAYPKEIIEISYLTALDYLDDSYIEESGYIYKLNKRPDLFGKLSKQILPIPNKIKIDFDLLKLFGYYISEGNIDDNTIRFTFSNKEKLYHEEIRKIVKEKFNLDITVEYSNSGNWTTLKIHSHILAKIFLKLFNKGFNKKSIPLWILTLPHDIQLGLIVGIFRGDGTLFKNGSQLAAKTVMCNKNTIHAAWTILARIGILGNFKEETVNKLSKHTAYRCQFNHLDNSDLLNLIFEQDLNKVVGKKRNNYLYKYIDGEFFAKITKINYRETEDKIPVFNSA